MTHTSDGSFVSHDLADNNKQRTADDLIRGVLRAILGVE